MAIPTRDLASVIPLLRGKRLVVLAGAGCSTESGIPDYRGPDGAARRRPPIQYQEFMRSESARARYWVRSAVGWPRISSARPNAAHRSLTRMEKAGAVAGVITQNVDGLHQAAGSDRVVELHGSLEWVVCTQCEMRLRRADYQGVLLQRNAAWAESWSRDQFVSAPDGDAELDTGFVEHFQVPPCDGCRGIMKPDVVLFGENVPRSRLEEAWRLFDEGDVLLVAGSSLTVFSGRRFVNAAVEQQKPVVVLNLGATRADHIATLKIDARLGEIMPIIADALVPQELCSATPEADR